MTDYGGDFKVPSDFNVEKKKSGGSSQLEETEKNDLDKDKPKSKSKDSFNDFDSDQDLQDPNGIMDGFYDDDDDDDHQNQGKQKEVNLDAFMTGDKNADDLNEDEEEEEEHQAEVKERGDFDDDDYDEKTAKHEEEEEEEEEEEYETEEEKETEEDGSLKTLEEIVKEQASERKKKQKLVKTKKRTLIQEYYEDLKKWDSLRFRNSVYATKIVNFIEKRDSVKDKYVQMYHDDQQRLKEAETLRRLNLREACEAMRGEEKDPKSQKDKSKSLKSKSQKKKKKTKAKKKSKARKHTKFIEEQFLEYEGEEYGGEGESELFSNDTSCEPPKYPIDELLEALEKRYPCPKSKSKSQENENVVVPAKGAPYLFHQKCGLGRKLKRITPKTKEFSFRRIDFFRDQPDSKDEFKLKLQKQKSRLMGMTLSQFGLVKQRTSQGGLIQWMETEEGSAKKRRSINKLKPIRGSVKLKKSLITSTSKQIARARKRWDIGQEKQEQKTRFDVTQVDSQHLTQFKFEFVPQRLTEARHASIRIRSDLMQLLKLRHIPTSHLHWPLQVKGTENKEGTNPFGRVFLNFTNPSHHEKGEPYVLYKILLQNLSYHRIKNQRLVDVHKHNLLELEEERQDLILGVEQVLADIIEGIRMWSNFCGMTAMEKFWWKEETEKFVTYVLKDYEQLMTSLVQLYSNIHSCQFALRQLAASEARGEGGDLNEFKDILRGREKLKAEHKNVEKMLENYQVHSKDILEITQKTDKNIFSVHLEVEAIRADLERIMEVVTRITEGMNYCQDLARRKNKQLANLRGQMGIVYSPGVMKEYAKMTTKIEEDETKKFQLRHLNHALVREMLKMAPSRS